MKMKNTEQFELEKYELIPPDGGWGYIIVLATVIIFSVTLIPMCAFGLIYGDFLKSLGDETGGTTLTNAIFNTVYSFTGLLANILLTKFSYRKVGFLGTVIYLLGACTLIFTQNLIQLIISMGIIQGIGIGLLLPAALSAFNSYFLEKMALMMSICQAFMIAFSILCPPIAAWSMKEFGFRGTLIGLGLLSPLCIPAVLCLQPVKFHMKKKEIIVEAPLMMMQKNLSASQKSLRKSVISLGDRLMASVTSINNLHHHHHEEEAEEEKEKSSGKNFWSSMDLALLKDFKYLNICIGLSLSFTGDIAFISIIPLMLSNVGFNAKEIALMISVFFGADLISRILLVIISAFFKLRSRLIILFTGVLIVLARTALVLNNSYTWKMSWLAILGFLRCFIQTPLPLVFSEEYQDKFSTAYSLFMAINGVVSLIYGPLMAYVKVLTGSDEMVCHVLTLAYLICVVTWTCELTCFRKRKVNK